MNLSYLSKKFCFDNVLFDNRAGFCRIDKIKEEHWRAVILAAVFRRSKILYALNFFGSVSFGVAKSIFIVILQNPVIIFFRKL